MKNLCVFLILLTLFAFVVACGEQKQTETQSDENTAMQAQEETVEEVEMAENMAVDPVCGMEVNKEEAQFSVEHNGETFYFCMEADKLAFVENPEKYLAVK